MHTFIAHFIADEPLIITDGTTEGMGHRCLSHVPGNMLLGAFATLWKSTHGGKSDGEPEFESLFLRGDVLWGHAVPTCSARPCLPIPRSWEYIKNEGGLPCYGSLGSSQIWNILRSPDRDAIPNNDAEKIWKSINERHLKRKRLPAGFIDVESYCAPDIHRIQATHVAIDPEQRRSQDGFLFGYEALAKDTRFCSLIICDESHVSALRTLLNEGRIIQVGHSRSAGYGSLRLEQIGEGDISGVKVCPGEHVVLLTSDYFPAESWKSPMGAFLEDISRTCESVRLNQEKTFSTDVRLEGFNSLWKAPRSSRYGIAAGSVVTFNTEKDGFLPYAVGGWQQEGYGRILCNPDLLEPLLIIPHTTANVESDVSPSEMSWPFMHVWRCRSLTRLAKEQALQAVWGTDKWDAFFTMLKDGKPSQSQRGNMRRMISSEPSSSWINTFQQILEKTPGKQWKSAVAFSPFNSRRESLDAIMIDLLECNKIDELFKYTNKLWRTPSIPGGPLTQTEKESFRAIRHQRLLLELLRKWERKARGGE